jgi:hypothetical protein
MTRTYLVGSWAWLVVLCGCAGSQRPINPFLTWTDAFGVPIVAEETQQQTTAQGTLTTPEFRQQLDLTFRNFHPSADLNVSFVAWVNTSSIRSAEQQDLLLSDGYVQLRREVRLGTAFTLPVGTFVYNGGGTAGATTMVLGPGQPATGAEGGATTPTAQAYRLRSPDVILAFYNPPVSCDSVAFYFSRNGEPLTAVPVGGPEAPYGGSNTTGGFKTLAQVDVYQCEPLRPGVFIKLGGGERQTNEYFEGEPITFDFYATPDGAGNFCRVTIGNP